MRFSPQILVCTEDTNELNTLNRIIDEKLPDAQQKSTKKSELLQRLDETSAHLLLLNCSAHEKTELSDLLETITKTQPLLLTVLIIPEERKELINFAVDNKTVSSNIKQFCSIDTCNCVERFLNAENVVITINLA